MHRLREANIKIIVLEAQVADYKVFTEQFLPELLEMMGQESWKEKRAEFERRWSHILW